MRLFFMTPGLGLGGAERWIVEMCRVLSDFEVVGVWPFSRAAHPDIVADLRALKIPITLPGEKVDADVVISWGIPYPRRYVGPTSKPLVVVGHGIWPGIAEDFFPSQAYEATHITAVSRAAGAAFGNYPVTVLYNGVPPERVARKEMDWRERWQVGQDEKVVLQVGRLNPEKRPDRLLEIAKYMPHDWVTVFCGDGVLRDNLIEDAKKSGCRVVFQSPVKEIGDVYAAADVVCVPSDREGMPLVVIEAWMAGKPVVITKIPFADEMTELHGKVFTTVNPDCPTEFWAHKIVQAALTSDETLAEIRRMAIQEYSAEAMGSRWREFLLTVAA